MRDNIYRRTLEMAEYVISTGSTVRATAEKFGLSKSTVHKDLVRRLWQIDAEKYARVRQILDKNLRERHIRGGLATKIKYKRRKKGHLSSNT